MSTIIFQNELSNELSVFIYILLIKKGYKLEEVEKADAIYGKGSKIGRAFLGAFINGFAFSVKITCKKDITSLAFAKHGKGYIE